MFPQSVLDGARVLLEAARGRAWMIVTAESCTGGLIAAGLTAVPGSSDVFDRGFVTYSNQAKQDMLGVPAALFERHGAVSEEVARAMAEGALAAAPSAHLALAVTGLAGPDGATASKPVGLVHVAGAVRDGERRHVKLHLGEIGRAQVRMKTVEHALQLGLDLAGQG